MKGQRVITIWQTAGPSLLLSKPFSSPLTAPCDKIYLNFTASHLRQESAIYFFLFSGLFPSSFLSQRAARDLVDEIHKSERTRVTKALVFGPVGLQSVTWVRVIYLHLLRMPLFLDRNSNQAKRPRLYVQNWWLYANFSLFIESQFLYSWDWGVNDFWAVSLFLPRPRYSPLRISLLSFRILICTTNHFLLMFLSENIV